MFEKICNACKGPLNDFLFYPHVCGDCYRNLLLNYEALIANLKILEKQSEDAFEKLSAADEENKKLKAEIKELKQQLEKESKHGNVHDYSRS